MKGEGLETDEAFQMGMQRVTEMASRISVASGTKVTDFCHGYVLNGQNRLDQGRNPEGQL